MDFDQRFYFYFVRTPFVIDESCKEVQTTFSMPHQSIVVALLAGLTNTPSFKKYSDSIIPNKESVADYHLD
jgi:hypothetical protein